MAVVDMSKVGEHQPLSTVKKPTIHCLDETKVLLRNETPQYSLYNSVVI